MIARYSPPDSGLPEMAGHQLPKLDVGSSVHGTLVAAMCHVDIIPSAHYPRRQETLRLRNPFITRLRQIVSNIRKTALSAILCGTLLGAAALDAAVAGPKFLYTLHNNQALRGFAITSPTGALAPLSGSPWIVPEFPFLLGMGKGPAGKFLYPVTPDSSVTSGFAVNPTTGALTPVPGSPFPFPPSGVAMTVHPSGKFAYLNAIAYDISPFIVNPTTGALTASGNVASAGVYPRLAIEPKGKCLYALNKGIFFIDDPAKTNNISAFSIDPASASGELTEIPGSPFPTGNNPLYFTFDPSGKYLVVSSTGSTDIRTYQIGPGNCALTQKAILTNATANANSITTTVTAATFFFKSASKTIQRYFVRCTPVSTCSSNSTWTFTGARLTKPLFFSALSDFGSAFSS